MVRKVICSRGPYVGFSGSSGSILGHDSNERMRQIRFFQIGQLFL